MFTKERRASREKKKQTAWLVLGNENHRIMCDALLLDVSPFGVRVHARGPIQPGQKVILIESAGERRCLRCEVRWVGKEGQLHRNAGLEFLEVTHIAVRDAVTPWI